MRRVAVAAALAVGLLTGTAPAAAQADALEAAARLVEEGRHAEARPLLVELMRREPGNGRAAFLAGRVHLSLNEADAAVRQLERAAQREPGNAEYHVWLGRAYGLQLTGANALRQRSIAGRMRDALEQAARLDPALPEPRLLLVEYYLRAPGIAGGDRQKALQHARALESRHPYGGALVVARVQATTGEDTAGAWQAYQEALRLDPELQQARDALRELG
jgi:tetratricopeptide (TPR) repeat protein